MTETSVRPYQPSDRADFHRIGADTAFFGEPVEIYMEDRQLFIDAFYRYYTDMEPGYAWVAIADGRVVGFLAGCTDSGKQEKAMGQKILPGVFWGIFTGKYRTGRLFWHYIWEILQATFRHEYTRPDFKKYPAHLHINIEDGWRGHGLGRRLINAYLDQLRREGVPGVHLETTDQNVVACKLYESTGFHLESAHSSGMHASILGHPVELRCYAQRLDEVPLEKAE